MLIKFFWIYIGSFFACSVALIFMVKNYADSFASKSKKPILWGGLSSAGISGGAYFATFISDRLFTVYWILALIYLLFGFIHVVFFHKRYFASNKNNRNRVIIGEILFMLSLILFTVVVFSSLQYFLRDKDFMFFPLLMSMLAFFIPIVLLYTFEAAYKIPPPEFATWYYPVNNPIELPDEKANEKLLVIAFEITKNAGDSVKTNFRAKGPDGMLLGDLYYHFLNDYNDVQSETPIKYSDKEGYPYEWWFRTKPKWYHKNRVLDPGLTFKDNQVKENAIIICERIIIQDQET